MKIHFSNKRVLLSVLDFHREAIQLLMFLLRCKTGCTQDRKEAQQQQQRSFCAARFFVCNFVIFYF